MRLKCIEMVLFCCIVRKVGIIDGLVLMLRCGRVEIGIISLEGGVISRDIRNIRRRGIESERVSRAASPIRSNL